jgi:hypothetical protein
VIRRSIMRKKLFLLSFVLMFGLVSNAVATDYDWTNWMAPDQSWTTNGNWTPAGTPTAAGDRADIDGDFTVAAGTCPIIDDTMNFTLDYMFIGRGTSNTTEAQVLMTGGVVNIDNRLYVADTKDSGAVGRLIMEHGTITLTGVGSSDRKFYVGYKGGVVTTSKGYFDMSGGLVDKVGKFYIAGEKSGSEVGWGEVNLSGGTINVDGKGTDSRVRIGGKGGTGTLNQSGGTLYSADDIIVADGSGSTGVLSMTGGYMRADGDFKVGSGDATASATVDLLGGIISAKNLSFDKDCGSMNIQYGTMVLDGDEVAEVQDLIDGGYIIAYNGAGTVLVNYWSAQDLTVVNAIIPEPATIALLGFGGLALLRRRK